MWGISSIEVDSPKRIKRWYATRNDPDDTDIIFDYTVEIYLRNDYVYEVYVSQLGSIIQDGWTTTLTAAKRLALQDTGFKSKDFEWIITEIS